jgi:hypothetical protein
LHLVGILFPHINDDARSKSHQILSYVGTGMGRELGIVVGLLHFLIVTVD